MTEAEKQQHLKQNEMHLKRAEYRNSLITKDLTNLMIHCNQAIRDLARAHSPIPPVYDEMIKWASPRVGASR